MGWASLEPELLCCQLRRRSVGNRQEVHRRPETLSATTRAAIPALKDRVCALGYRDQNVVREASRVAKSVEAKLESLTTVNRDSGLLAFEDLGIDMILVDEADLYKNLFFFTKKKRIPGISSAFSSRALDRKSVV